MVTLVIDNKTVCVPEGTSILDAARTASIDIPTLCYLKELRRFVKLSHATIERSKFVVYRDLHRLKAHITAMGRFFQTVI